MEHIHENDHEHEHSYVHEHENHEEESFSIKETKVLIKYMIAHNTTHNKEIIELAQKIKQNGYISVYETIMKAVESFTIGNDELSKALEELDK